MSVSRCLLKNCASRNGTPTVPGRTNETWVRITREGVYKGQCSELCGVNHGFMPISVTAVSKDAYKAWVMQAQEKYAKAGESNIRIAKAINLAQ